ncbi:hypothetical protein FNV43_RR14787 [Rhamnella rubrinervis]|uniref:Uncharacterized protein n=1 Tax=Rhamnella rubrinervis TaxID=2594499 RepID=A0A8K0H3T9_9ROSA|nr:hypothetical protein FNV43_RR14787 [Rhamnella rubrinervis]
MNRDVSFLAHDECRVEPSTVPRQQQQITVFCNGRVFFCDMTEIQPSPCCLEYDEAQYRKKVINDVVTTKLERRTSEFWSVMFYDVRCMSAGT